MENLPSKIKWGAPEYEFHEKTPEWYWALGIITAALVLAAVILHNFLFAVFAVLAGFSVGLYGTRRPRTILHEINSGGVSLGNKNFNYEHIDHFWINYNPPAKRAYLGIKKNIFHPYRNLAGQRRPEQIRRYLLQYLKEKRLKNLLSPLSPEF